MADAQSNPKILILVQWSPEGTKTHEELEA